MNSEKKEIVKAVIFVNAVILTAIGLSKLADKLDEWE